MTKHDGQKLYAAFVSEDDEGILSGKLTLQYVVLAPSRAEAEVAIKAARNKPAEVKFFEHRYDAEDIIKRYGLRDGVARAYPS